MGAGPSIANEVRGYEPKLLHDADPKKVLSHLKFLAEKRDCDRLTKIIIVNKSSHPLEFKECNSLYGFFFTETDHAFAKKRSIAPRHTGGILHTKNARIWCCGSAGYVSFRVVTKGKHYVVCCGFSTVYMGTNSLGLEIRGEDGVLDAAGNIAGHGVDPTGNVSDIQAFVTSTYYAYGVQNAKTKRHEACRIFRVEGLFNNKNHSTFKFVVEDVKDATQQAHRAAMDAVEADLAARQASTAVTAAQQEVTTAGGALAEAEEQLQRCLNDPEMSKLQFSGYRLQPMGSHPRIADKRATYDLFGPVKKLWSAIYDRAMTAFVACLKVAMQWCANQDGVRDAPPLQHLGQEGPSLQPEH